MYKIAYKKTLGFFFVKLGDFSYFCLGITKLVTNIFLLLPQLLLQHHFYSGSIHKSHFCHT